MSLHKAFDSPSMMTDSRVRQSVMRTLSFIHPYRKTFDFTPAFYEQQCPQSSMSIAKERQAADRPLYEQCKNVGETQFNRGRPIAHQRSIGCAYEKRGTGGPNSKGKTWKRLLPGACRDNTFVGRDGLDCCNGNPISDGPLDIECRGFYLKW
jgi:hypothetical protein